jgi:hypothetical protein
MNDATVAARSSAIDGIALGSGARGRFDGDTGDDTAPNDRDGCSDGCSDVREGDSGGVRERERAAWLDTSRGEGSGGASR